MRPIVRGRKLTGHYKYIVLLDLLPPAPPVRHIYSCRSIALADPKRRFSCDEITLLLDECNFGDEEHDNLAQPGITGCNPLDKERTYVGFAAASVQCSDDISFLCAREDLFLVPARKQGFSDVWKNCHRSSGKIYVSTFCIVNQHRSKWTVRIAGLVDRKGEEGDEREKRREMRCENAAPLGHDRSRKQ